MRRKDVEFGSVPDVGKRILDREQYEDQMFMFHVRMVRLLSLIGSCPKLRFCRYFDAL